MPHSAVLTLMGGMASYYCLVGGVSVGSHQVFADTMPAGGAHEEDMLSLLPRRDGSF